jgi:hypothetical protein
MTKKIVSIVPVSGSPLEEHDITVRFTPGWFASALGFMEKTTVYRGSGTVWREFPSGKRAPTWLESNLADVLARHRFNVSSKTATS